MKTGIICIYLIILYNFTRYIALNEIRRLGDMIRYRRWLLPLKLVLCFVRLEQLMNSITNHIIHYSGSKMNLFSE
jgi:hypothetical protein